MHPSRNSDDVIIWSQKDFGFGDGGKQTTEGILRISLLSTVVMQFMI